MKKTFLALFAVLLVLMLATCDDSGGTPSDQTVPEGMASITIDLGDIDARRLNVGNAQAAVDYYEVVFKTSTNVYYQIKFADGASQALRTIVIPGGDYTGENSAVMFAGKENTAGSDYTLLAIGTISKVGGVALASIPAPNAGKAWIEPGATSVTFKLTALTNGVNTTAKEPNSSTFKITGPTVSNDADEYDYATATTTNKPAIGTTTTGNYPVFPIPAHTYDNTGGSTTGDITASYSVTIPFYSAVKRAATSWSAKATTISVGSETGVTVSGGGIVLTPTSFLTANATLSATSEFTFGIDLANCTGDGLCAVSIKVPVYALTNTAPLVGVTPMVWNIRGGSDITDPPTSTDGVDDGSGDGNAVLLSVGSAKYSNFKATVEITPPTKTPGDGWEP